METKMISLYDYLGKAAGAQLGAKVYAEAKKRSIQVKSKTIHTKTYSGEVLTYPENFLNEYFSKIK